MPIMGGDHTDEIVRLALRREVKNGVPEKSVALV